MPTVQELVALVRRVGGQLEREPRSRPTLLDMSTVLMFVAYWLSRALAEPMSDSAAVDRARASGLLTVMLDSLQWVRSRRETASVDDMYDRLMLAVGSARQILTIIETQGS